jgi:hypothetical protein
MGKVCAGATMSLDGYIAGPEDSGFELLFKWYGAGDVVVPMPHRSPGVPDSTVSGSVSAEVLHDQDDRRPEDRDDGRRDREDE